MSSSGQPLRRRYGIGLGLGLLAAFACLWFLSRPERQEVRSAAARADGEAAPVVRSEAALDPAPFEGARQPEGVRAAQERATGVRSPEPRSAPPSPKERAEEDVLVVRVLDARGLAVAGVPVELGFATERDSNGGRVGVDQVHPVPRALVRRALFPTDELGLARIPVSHFLATDPADLTFLGYVLRVRVPQREAVELDLGRAVPAPGQVTLRLPPSGALRLSVRTADDRPAPDGSTVVAEARIAGETRFRSSAIADVRDGVAVFPCVDLDAEFRLRGMYASVGGQSGERMLAGPTYSGETVEATLRLGVEWPRLRLRAVTESREPLATTRIEFRIVQAPRSPQSGGEWTDEAGTVELLVLGPQRSEFRHEIELWVLGPRSRRAMLLLPEELAYPTDLGDVVFRLAPPGSVPPDR
jgi:hypothetical protein